MDVLEASRITPEMVAEHGLSDEEYSRILKALGREPNLVELGIFSVMWSEHCSYKSSRVHLKKLPTEAPWVICGPGENAGVIDIGDGDAAIFKMESHNHPSYIEPYQGAATGVGGILRDVFTMGARPIANLNALRFGRPDHPKTRHLVAGVVAGIGGYGNCVGVPTVGGEVNFDAAYDGNILVNAMTVGVAKADKIFYSAAAGVGNSVVYVGSKTGRDGIHGATMASADFSEDSEEKRPTVQVGDPFTEKLLIEACLELMASDAIVAIQDMGAAGLTSSSVEMASKGGVGIELDMNAVPCREEGMIPYEMMLSESQERMLMVLKPCREAEAEAIFRKWELDFAVIGRVTDRGHMVLKWNGETAADLPLGARPLAATDCMNFGNPERPEIMGQFVGCIEGMAEACRALDFPIVSGNVSLYNETKNEDGASQAILPTPAIGGVGLIEDWQKAVGIGFKGPGDVIVAIGDRHGHLGQSLWLRELHGREDGPPPPVDLLAEHAAGTFVRAAIAGGAITACHDISSGGIAVALAEMALAGGVGALINHATPGGNAGFFAEDQGVYLATICDNCLLTFLARAHAAGVEVDAIGRTAGKRLIFELADRDHSISLAELARAHEGFFPALMGDSLAIS